MVSLRQPRVSNQSETKRRISLKKLVNIQCTNAAKVLLWQAAKVLPFFLLAVINLNGQSFGPDYLQNYWAPANARSIGMGKGTAALHDEAISTSLLGANYRDFNAFTMSYGMGFNAFPELPGAETRHFAIGASLNKSVMLSINSNVFQTDSFLFLDELGDTLGNKILQKNFSANLGFSTKSEFLFAFNLDFLTIGEESVRAIGFSIGADSDIISSKQSMLKVGFVAGINGLNAFVQEIVGISGKIAPQKFALGGSADYRNESLSKWLGTVKYGIEYQNYVNYSNLKLFRTGLEVELLQYIFLRGGFYIDDPQGNGKLKGFTAGAGLVLPFGRWFKLDKGLQLRFDGAFLPYPDFSQLLDDEIDLDSQSMPEGKTSIISVTFRAEL